jgi:hypothetical protein
MPEVSYAALGQVNLVSSINFDLQVCEYRTGMLNIQYQDVESQGKILQVFIQGLQRLAGFGLVEKQVRSLVHSYGLYLNRFKILRISL